MIVVVAGIQPKEPVQGPLEGEDIETEHWEDARHWMSIYDDLIRFKLGLLERVKRELPKLHPVAQQAAHVDVTYIEAQMAGYYERLDLWYERVWKLQGLWLDPDGRILRHNGKEAVLTNREFELLEYLLRHQGHHVSREMLVREVWKEPRRAKPLDNVIDVQMTRLRKKVDTEEGERLIHTVRGVGFVLREGEP